MTQRHRGRHRRPTRRPTVASLARPALAVVAAASVPLAVAAPAHAAEHTVAPGDTLSRLAAAHGTTWQTIYAENGGVLSDPNRLRVGQVLTIGGATAAPATTAPATTASGEYVVRAGDTLGRIAAAHGTTWQQLHALNRGVVGADPNTLRVGQRLTLGGVPAPAAAAPRVAERAASRSAERAAPAAAAGAYDVWAPHVRPAVQEVAERFGVGSVVTRPGHSPTEDLAADFMVHTDRAKGDAVAQYVIDNAARFRVEYVIWQQRIYQVRTGTWQAMADRGSPTANHMDHPHVSFLPG
ncbi:LysM repeat protein [Modestobacter roseus]|uniref:LysM repeat protein n=1 Tax=Modestobacter roseus TaxID=1181884 RepID=A0A562IPK2_9ACTN|nr:LysM peptidoglycan-binding domain-containing protein [Modestobacter roseus]TWH72911.1 LysM repeat protein [Modestobacter roseus]